MQFKGLFTNPWGPSLQETAINNILAPDCDDVALATGAHAAPVVRPTKRAHYEAQNHHAYGANAPKRIKIEPKSPSPPAVHHADMHDASHADPGAIVCEQLGLEVLLKHQELRLIDQELAKCQIALEQLRRCHLIPYPTNCPTPEQMLEISSGKGPALKSVNGKTPPHAPPFGVVDGPYARHYAKWLIPDPSFDGVEVGLGSAAEAPRARLGGKHSIIEGAGTRGRPTRGAPAPRLEAIPSSYAPRPRDKSNIGPCIIARADGVMVKLVCTGCSPSRDNFSNTQGFINHCRISHGHHLKSHDEAAAQCGQPVDGTEAAPAVAPQEKQVASPPPPPPAPAVALSAHPLTRADMTHAEACASLKARIDAYFEAQRACNVKTATRVLSTPVKPPQRTLGPQASTTPNLARVLQARGFQGDIESLVNDAKTKDWDDSASEDEASDEASPSAPESGPVRKPVMRVPARATAPCLVSDVTSTGEATPTSIVAPRNHMDRGSMSEDDMEAPSLSPNGLTANNAPSLVSDDGEYDESDEGSSVSGQSDSLDAESVSHIAEIGIDDENEPRGLRRGPAAESSAVRLGRDNTKESVSLVSPVRNGDKRRRHRQI